ncbi:carbohydrate ABC transporter permease [Paenibacillus cremeus]|uniref:Sugar ABC transporter permease n=1 Tax=Paenibacillus cremeus TaxID=2163881 RepID=A0A559KG64_9BACL|nr:sugar ABC transporter permease [Paenibacillus cremeus]TVY11119.1 sugar ABC transporter permease [Paenibacillus cremeus]
MNAIRSFWKTNWVGYMFVTPWLIGLLGLSAFPMGYSLYLAFTNYDLFTTPKWIGTSNFVEMVHDKKYLASVGVTIKYVLLSVPLSLSFALSIALLLNRGIRGLRVYRAIYYVPSLFGGSVAVALLWRQIFGGEGLINSILHRFGLEGMNWIATPSTALYTLIILSTWQFGSAMVIFLAGIKQIPADLYESARMDGAGRWRQFQSITFPMLTPIIFFNLVMNIIHAFQAFTSAYIVSGGAGGPLNSTLFYTLYLYQKGFAQFNMGYAAAMAWMLLITIAFITSLIFVTSGRWVHYQE